jgi:anti-sigma factor RsiW
MTCDELEPRLSALVDGSLPVDEQDAIRAHMQGCARCRGLVQDFDRVRRAATSLGPKTPPDHVWTELAERVRFLDSGTVRVAGPGRSRRAIAQWIGLAAALVIVTIGAYLVTRETPGPPAGVAAGNGAAAGTVEAVAEELNLAMTHYERAIAELEALARTDTNALNDAVKTELAQNIQTIDRAISESRGAILKDPGSAPARESLFEALRRKVGVLQATVTLMNEMRKGNQTGAAEAAAAFGKKS